MSWYDQTINNSNRGDPSVIESILVGTEAQPENTALGLYPTKLVPIHRDVNQSVSSPSKKQKKNKCINVISVV